MENMFFQQASAEDFIAETGRDAKMKKAAGKEHLWVYFICKPRPVIESGRTKIPPLNFPVGRDGGIVAAYDVCIGLFGGATCFLVHDRGNPVVAVHESDIFAGYMSKSLLSCGDQTAVLFMETAEAPVLSDIFVT